jgi:hypothetical protein
MKSLLNPMRVCLSLARRRGPTWLASYVRQQLRNARVEPGSDCHIIFTFVDHFEPSRALGERGVELVGEWCRKNAEISSEVTDDDGIHPQHTWFYRYDYPSFECLRQIARSSFEGFGEIEFHLHHGNDTPETFKQTIEAGKRWFASAGAMSAVGSGTAQFAYIAGNWSLANGQGDPSKSGVNDEIRLLRDAQCYADFTFPAFGERSQPRQVNSLYYATQSDRIRCYDTGPEVIAGGRGEGDLLIFQGPLFLDFRNGLVDYAAVENYAPYFAGRFHNWINAGVRVTGRPNWTFIKVHTHGMQSADTVVGSSAALMYREAIEIAHKRGYKVHFASAREAYNIVKAAEAGRSGDPGEYRDFLIPKPITRVLYCSEPAAVTVTEGELNLEVLQPRRDTRVTIDLNVSPIASICGPLRSLSMKWTAQELGEINVDASGDVELVKRK